MLHRIKRSTPKLLRFVFVGTIGAIINFVVYSVVMEYTSLGINLSSICAFGVAVINNYVINHRWTFAAENESNPINRTQFIYYVLGNVMGLLVNLLVLNVIVAMSGIRYHLVGQMLGIACGMVFNFLFAKKIVFPVVNGRKTDLTE